MKVDAEGVLQWERNFGGAERDYATFAAGTRDGGFILTGQQRSFDPVGSYDVSLVRTDAAGNLVWQSSFGGEESDQGAFARETDDGGFIVAAYTKSFGAAPPVPPFPRCGSGPFLTDGALGCQLSLEASCP